MNPKHLLIEIKLNFSPYRKSSPDITPYRTAASVPLALCPLCRCVEPLLCHLLGLAGTAFTSEFLLFRSQSWLAEQPPPEDDSGSEVSASNSWLSCRASNTLAGAGAAGTVLDRDTGKGQVFARIFERQTKANVFLLHFFST